VNELKTKRLDMIRKKIDKIDSNLIELIGVRLSLMPEVAKIKSEIGLTIRQLEREKQLLKKIKKMAIEKNISQVLAEKIFTLLIKESCLIQEKTTGAKK